MEAPPSAEVVGGAAPLHLDLDVVTWRYTELDRAGYPADIAIMLAERGDVDLHHACGLLAAGATVHQALRILT